jgi:hypothetical protein
LRMAQASRIGHSQFSRIFVQSVRPPAILAGIVLIAIRSKTCHCPRMKRLLL